MSKPQDRPYRYKLLAIDDHPATLKSIELILGDRVVFTGVSSPEDALEFLQREQFDIVISDYNLNSDINGVSIFKKVQRQNPFATACLMTAEDAAPIVRDVFEAFGGIFIEKPICEDSFIEVFEQARRNRVKFLEVAGEETQEDTMFRNIVAETPSMVKLIENIKVVSPQPFLSVHMCGPTGTGKSTLAEIIHARSGVKGKLVTVNCAGLEELAMSRLFGHVKGAFTGAMRDHDGFIKQADGGTLFLDELHLLSRDVQGKLLRVLQDGKYQRLGETVDRTSHFRLLTAASVDVRRLADMGGFLPDLWYRISGKIFSVPALSERKACIPRLVYQQIQAVSKETGRAFDIEPPAMDILVSFSWNGNIRDLRNSVQSLCSDAGERGLITAEMVKEDLSKRAGYFVGAGGIGMSPNESLDQACRSFEMTLIRKALNANANNIAKAAKTLGMPRNTLKSRMDKLGVFVSA